KKWILVSLFVLVATIIAITNTARFAADAAKKPLAEQATIRRDTFGVPHILAETEEAAAFAMGYAQAEDHSVEIARRFLSARGEEAKYTGAGVETDFESKRYGIHEIARKNFTQLSPLMQQIHNAFAAGFNRYVEKNRKSLPAWIPTFDGVDVLARSRQEVFRFTFNRGNLIGQIKQKYATNVAQLDSSFTHEVEMNGSNMWAIAGSRTTSGKPILLGNPHQPWSVLYWEAHITVPGKINLFGTTYAGLPVLRHGFNDTLGWTHTVNNIDPEDVYALKLDPKNAAQYVFDGKPQPLVKKAFTIEVKQTNGSLKSETREFTYSHLGPVIHQTSNKAFAIKSSILEEVRFFEQWYAMGKARNWQEFRAALKMNLLPMFNLTYADVDGNTFYLWCGMMPQRVDDGTDYRLDVPGDTGKYVWTKLHAMEELPQLLNPKGGYLQNCNSAPWWTSLRDAIDPRKFPSYFETGNTLSLRSQMSLEMLESKAKFSFYDVRRLKYNTIMLLADRVKPDLIKAIKALPKPSEELAQALFMLELWDNSTSDDSRGGPLFQRFWDTYRVALKEPFAEPWDVNKPATTPSGLADTKLALQHLEDAVRWMRTNWRVADSPWGGEKAAWGEINRFRIGDLEIPADGAGGEYGLFRVVQSVAQPDGKRIVGTVAKDKPMVGGGDGWVMAVEFTKPIVAYSVLAYGQTSNLQSKHSTDQLRLFANHQYKRAWFSEADIKANLEREYRP
ncbi:MAG TPA: penicillin acylase family protein, partial [Blastocatellia bacterium]|nr:penicillin acylase family protein [Blastocatellia bacterium]